MHRNHRQSRKMKKQVTCFKQNKIKEQNKNTKTEVKRTEDSDLPAKEFKIMVIKNAHLGQENNT